MDNLGGQLNIEFWEQWFYSESFRIPQGRDSWYLHVRDTQAMYLMGGEL